MKKKTLIFMMVVVAALLSLNANAYDVTINGIYYNLNLETQTAEVVGGDYVSTRIGPRVYAQPMVIPESVDYEGVCYSVTSIGRWAFSRRDDMSSVIIPNSVTSIGDHAFCDCIKLTSVDIPNSVISISDHAFQDCSELTSVTLPNSVTSIGEGTFQGCTNLTDIIIPNRVTSIANYVFWGCKSLKSVTIPNSVISIGCMAFWNCSNLASLAIPYSVTSIDIEAFSGCGALTSITVDEKNSIYDSREDCNAIIETRTNQLIRGCSNTYIPNSVESIAYKAFRGCTGLTSVIIPNSLTRIGDDAFQDCTNLASVIVKQAKPLTIHSNVFSEDTYQNCVLYVPNGQRSYYIYENGWSSFSHVEEMEMPDVDIDKSPFANVGYNQMVLGHYTGDDEYNDEDDILLSQGFYKCCISFSKEQMKPFVGNKITHVRFALVNTDISSVRLWISSSCETDALYTQDISDIQIGWNEVKLEKAFDIQDDSVFIGIEYLQDQTNCPISYQHGANKGLGGSFYLCYPSGKWVDFATNYRLCARFQCLLEGDMIPLYDIHTTGITLDGGSYYKYKSGETIAGYLWLVNWGRNIIDEYEIAYTCDGQEMGTSTVRYWGGAYFSFTPPDFSVGLHTITAYVKSINGEKPLYTDDDTQSVLVKVYDKEMDRQKIYLESFTATWCPYTIGTLNDLKKLTEQRNDVSLVQLHSSDELSCDAVNTYRVFYTGTPELSSNRFAAPGTSQLNYVYSIPQDIDMTNNMPSFANVNIAADYNPNNGELKIKVTGERNDNFVKLGEDVNLTVLLTEDNIINPQYDGVNRKYIYDYSHQAVLRTNVSDVWGDPVEWRDDKYEKTYTIYLDEKWVANNMKIVSFLAKPFTGNNYDEIYVMNCNDFAIKNANMDIPSYKLIYMLDGEIFKTCDIEYGATITAEAEPTKEGYVFSGWNEIPARMPAKDVTVIGSFTINNYRLAYKLDGKTYKAYLVEYGASIIPEEVPEKEGFTFSGWSEIPATMPAKGVTVTGTFTINKYTLTYMVDGETYKTYEVEYGTNITPEAEPTKEGYRFSGWSLIPTTMPAKDVIVTGSFTKGRYKLVYKVDGQTYKTVSFDYGAAITPENAPEREGYTFSGWSEIPATMPAKDVMVTSSFSVNTYTLTYMVDGETYKTDEVEYGASITPEVDPEKEGYTFSGWSEIPESMPAKDVTVTGCFTFIDAIEDVITDDCEYRIFTIDGKPIDTLQKGINIIRYTDGKVTKVLVK